jgi:hypothetical protein
VTDTGSGTGNRGHGTPINRRTHGPNGSWLTRRMLALGTHNDEDRDDNDQNEDAHCRCPFMGRFPAILSYIKLYGQLKAVTLGALV